MPSVGPLRVVVRLSEVAEGVEVPDRQGVDLVRGEVADVRQET
jgi:hypothetical protein